MKNNYSSIRNINKTAATVKRFFIAIVLVASASFNNAFGTGVVITAPSLTVTGCSFPTPYSNLNNIVISETSPGDISTFGSLIITAPANFEFMPTTGAVGYTGGDITGATISISASNVTVNLTGGGGASMNVITISGLKVRGVTGASGATNITRNGGTAVIANDVNGTTHAVFTSVLNTVDAGYFSGPDQTICYGGNPAMFIETVASSGIGVLSSEWKHSTDSYSATLATTANYDAPPGLINTTTYVRIAKSVYNGITCTDSSNFRLVNVMPVVNGGSLSSAQTICNGSAPSVLTGPVGTGGDGSYTYLWQQSIVNPTTGFTPATFTNSTVNYSPPALSNTTWYRRKVSSAGCNSTDSAAIKMTIDMPVVTNPSTFTTCSGAPINIGLTSNVPCNFTWTIGSISGGISGASASSGNNILQTLTNSSNSVSGAVQYIITPTSQIGSCNGPASTITVTVNPAPSVTSTTNATICSGTSPNIALAASLSSNFSWTIGGITGGITGASAGTGFVINQLLNNPNTSSGTVPYNITPTSISDGCVGNPFTTTILVNPKPLVTNPSTSTICDMTSPNIALTANVSSVFSLAIGTITGGITGMTQSGSLTTINHTLANPGTVVGTVQHIITPTSSAGACIGDPYTITVTVNPKPILTSPLSGAACSGVLYSYTPTSSVSGTTFTWSRAVVGGISNILKTGTNDPVEFLINTTTSPVNVTYSYTLSINGCQNPTNFNLVTTVNPSPELSSTLFPSPICSGAPFNYTALSLTPGATFSWTRAVVPGISNPAGSGIILSETLTNTTANPINVTYIYTTTANGCSKTQNVIVTVNPIPALNSSLTATICSGMIFNYNPTSATSGVTFDWTRAAVPGVSNYTTNGTNDPNETLEDTTAFTVNVNYDFTTAAYGCSTTETLVVSVDPAPKVTNSSNYFSCSGTNPNIALTASLASAFAWTLGENPGGIIGGSNSVGDTLNQTLTNPNDTSTYSLQYNVTATSISGTCSGYSSAIFINVNPQPLANAGSNSTICSDSSVIIGGFPTAKAGTGPYTYSWSPSTGLDSPTLSNPSANPAVNTTYSVTVTDSLGCAASISSMTVAVNPAPNVNAGTDVSICIGNNVTLYASGGTSYLWSNGSITDSITVNPTVNTTYTVMGTANGCSHSDTVLVTVNPLPVVNGGNDTTICAGQSIILNGNGNGSPYTWNNGISNGVSFTPTATTTYVVSGTVNGCSKNDTVLVTVNAIPVVNGGNDTIICAGQSIILSGNGNGSPFSWNNGISNGVSFTPTATTAYVVSGTLNGCSKNDTVLVTVNALPIVSISASVPICEGDSATLTASGGITFAWSTGAITNSTTVTPSTTTTYTVTVTNANNCSDNATATVIVNLAPIANAGMDFTICIGDTATLSGAGGLTYAWTDGTNSFTTSTILVNPVVSTVYSLSVTDNVGCSDYDTAMVNVTPSKDIFGTVRYSGGPVTSGMAVLYKYVQFQSRFDSVQYVPLNPSTGDYAFTNVNYGEYIVKVVVDSTSYPMLMNTYYGDEFLWNGDSVHVIDHTCASNTTLDSITMVELTGTGGGVGLIIGQIIEGISFGRVEGEPIPGVDIYLGKNPGGIVATSNTDSTGHFTFSGVADGNYTIYVDIPGLGRDSSYTFTVDSTNNQFLNQNYIADSNSVFMNPTSTVGISNLANVVENKFSVYPNPVIGNTTIEYSILQMTDVKTTLEITTVLGVKISSLINTTQQAGTYKYNFNPQNYQLNAGVYFITLTINGKASTKRIVVME